MLRPGFVLVTLLAARSVAGAPAGSCDPAAIADAADTARSNIIAAVNGAGALAAWNEVFDRAALRVYRAGALGSALDRALAGCVDTGIEPEAVIAWDNVREIEAGNWVLWFKLRQPVEIRSDRGKHEKVRELKAYFQGAGGGELTYYYNVRQDRVSFWNFDVDVYGIENLRGIAVGPTDFQRRLQFVLARAVDPQGRIALPRKGRGAGW